MMLRVKFTAIYGLFDPRKPALIWYVGKGLNARANSHWRNFLNKNTAVNKKLLQWLIKLQEAGVQPQFRFLEENVPANRWKKWERYHIAKWRKLNPKLCNVTAGGNAWSQDACRKGGSLGGRKVFKKKLGIFARLPKKAQKDAQTGGRIGGQVSGRNHRLNGTGIFTPGAADKGRQIQKELGLGIYAPGVRERGGQTSGRNHALNETGFCAPGAADEGRRLGGQISGLLAYKNKTGIHIPGIAVTGGRTQGTRNAENGHLKHILHIRWDVNRNIYNSDCKFCRTEDPLMDFLLETKVA
ncbi:MAG: hypothetical protein ACYDBV_15330 [Nitrospiria bacterium]